MAGYQGHVRAALLGSQTVDLAVRGGAGWAPSGDGAEQVAQQDQDVDRSDLHGGLPGRRSGAVVGQQGVPRRFYGLRDGEIRCLADAG